MPTILRVSGLSKAYSHVRAADGVGFEIAAGEIFGLLGVNGAGKTTTVESIAGLLRPDAGEIEICGIDALGRPHLAKQKVGVALQSTGLQDKITPLEALAAFAAFYERPLSPQALLDRFGLSAKARAPYDSLSGGQKQRLALSLAFVNDPQLICLDEPTASLDPQVRRELHGYIRELAADGRAVLLTTHDMEEAEHLCDRVAIIDAGRIVAEGSPSQLIARSSASVRVRAQMSAPLHIADLPQASALIADGAMLSFTASDLNTALTALLQRATDAGVAVVGLQAARASLEDVIIELTGAAPRE